MSANTMNTGMPAKLEWAGFTNTVLVSFTKHTFVNKAACTLAAITTLLKANDPLSRMYIISGQKTEQPTATPKEAQYDLTKETLYNEESALKLMISNAAAQTIRDFSTAYNGAELYVYMVTNKNMVVGITLDNILVEPILCKCSISVINTTASDSKYLVVNLQVLDADTKIFNPIEIKVPGLTAQRGFQNVQLSIETSPAASATTFYSKVVTSAEGTAVGGLVNADFVLTSTLLAPKTITTTTYEGSGIYKHVGTGFATEDILDLAPASTITLRYETEAAVLLPTIT